MTEFAGMTISQFKTVLCTCFTEPTPSISVDDLSNKTPRTLVLGYHQDRTTMHVYLDELGLIHALEYVANELRSHTSYTAIPITKALPTNRAYPEATDYEFTMLMLKLGLPIPFTYFNENREPKQFHGKLLSDFR